MEWKNTGFAALASVAAVSAGCGAGIRHDVVGSARTTIGDTGPHQRTLSAVAVGHPDDPHLVALSFYLPRAIEVHYRVTCPGERTEGVIGETFEHYRQRRVAQLEQQRRQQAAAVGSVVGAAAGAVGVQTHARAPGAEVEVEAEAHVDGAAAGEAIADHALPPVQLDPRDTGAQWHKQTVRMQFDAVGQCTLSVWSERDDQDMREVYAEIQVTREVDIGRERAAKRAHDKRVALEVRGSVNAQLVAGGADPHLRERERAAAKAAEQARRARLDAEAQARRRAAYETRGVIVAGFVAQGCDPHARERKRQEAQRAQWQRRERRVRLERERRVRQTYIATECRGVRERVVRDLVSQGADPSYRRRQNEAELRAYQLEADRQRRARIEVEARLARQHDAALRARAGIKVNLVARGAVDRPPRPPVQAEARPPQPGAGAAWIGGQWQWAGARWQWMPGYWTEPPSSAAIWVPPVEIVIEGAAVLRPGGWRHRKTGKRVRRRDHRKRSK